MSYILHSASCLYSSGFCTQHSDVCIMHHVFSVLHSAPCLYNSGFYTMHSDVCILHHVFTVLDYASCPYSSAFWCLHSSSCLYSSAFSICPQILHHVSCLCNLIVKLVCLRNYVILRHSLYILKITVTCYLSAIYMNS